MNLGKKRGHARANYVVRGLPKVTVVEAINQCLLDRRDAVLKVRHVSC